MQLGKNQYYTGKRSENSHMVHARNQFRQVVQAQLMSLVENGVEREVASRILLHRIVPCPEIPLQHHINTVMRDFGMNVEDATRALIVKQELVRLKEKGLTPLEAIEEITRKIVLGTYIDTCFIAIGPFFVALIS